MAFVRGGGAAPGIARRVIALDLGVKRGHIRPRKRRFGMKDNLGLYYYPDPADKKTRVYVCMEADEVHFRVWRDDHPQVWDRHGWVPYSAIEQAAGLYKEMGRASDPMRLYDIGVAKVLLREG